MLLNVSGSFLRFWIVPGGVLILFAIYDHVIVVRSSFPGAGGGVIAGLQVLSLDAFRGEVMIAFDLLSLLALG